MKIPIVIVDDDENDRYLVKRNIKKNGSFGDLVEMHSGEMFLEQFFNSELPCKGAGNKPILVLMDVNMPGRDGFETAEEAQRRIAEGKGPESIVVMMFTSSNNISDKKKAEELKIVKGYISKPLDGDGIQYIQETYTSSV